MASLITFIPSEVNIHKICRLCLQQNDEMTPIFNKLQLNEVNETQLETLADILGKLTSVYVKEADGFPTLICMACVQLICSAYKFKILFDNSQNILQQFVIDRLKEELQFDYLCQDEVETSVAPKRKVHINKSSENSSKNEPKASQITHACPICTKEFPASELRSHAHTHKALKKYLNIPSNKRVPTSTQFFEKPHLRPRLRKQILHKCVYCSEEFSATDLRIHLLTHRNQAEYKCDQCERVFRRVNHLNTHRVKHLKEFPYKCEKCGKGFVIKTNYDCHVLIHDTNQELPHECRICLKRFSNPEHLNRHMVMHNENVSYSVKYRVCKCYHCLKTFKDRFDLKAHVCVPIEQSAKTKFHCKTCNKIFKTSSGLYSHNRNIHQMKAPKVLCSICGNRVSNIYNHTMRHTGEKPYQCNQCGKRFVGKPQLRQHLLVHSGLKPYVCSVCAKAFNNLYNLQVHERIHKGDRCHVCKICNKGFLEKSYLKKHMNVHMKL